MQLKSAKAHVTQTCLTKENIQTTEHKFGFKYISSKTIMYD